MPKKIFNLHEEVTNQRLVSVCAEYDAHAYPKVRIADVLPIENSGISDSDFTYALKAHFDFVICDKEFIPQFAVEFDGRFHNEIKQINLDNKKNSLCQRFEFPILRINSNHLPKKYKEYDLLSWCVDNWFLAIEFYKAQEEGYVPWDEPYDPMMFITLPGKKSRFPMWLASKIRLRVQELSKRGKIITPFIPHWIGVDEYNNYRGISWIKVKGNFGVSVETGMKKQLFPVSETELLSEILCFQIMERIEDALEGKGELLSYESIMSRVKFYSEHLREASFAGYANENPNKSQS